MMAQEGRTPEELANSVYEHALATARPPQDVEAAMADAREQVSIRSARLWGEHEAALEHWDDVSVPYQMALYYYTGSLEDAEADEGDPTEYRDTYALILASNADEALQYTGRGGWELYEPKQVDEAIEWYWRLHGVDTRKTRRANMDAAVAGAVVGSIMAASLASGFMPNPSPDPREMRAIRRRLLR